MQTQIVKCQVKDLSVLLEISISTFYNTYFHLNPPGIVEQYIKQHFTKEKLKKELNSANIEYYFCIFQNNVAAYLRLNQSPNQSDFNDQASIEIERIYVAEEYKNLGLGKALIEFAEKRTIELNKSYLWLGVWEKNVPAILFYEKMGFLKTDAHDFWMGDERQVDYVMKKQVGLK